MGMIDNPRDSRQGWADFRRRVADLERVGPASSSGGGPAVETTYTVATHDPSAGDGLVSYYGAGLHGTVLEPAADVTAVGAEFFCTPWGTGDWLLECWTITGAAGATQTLGAKVGDTSTLTLVDEPGTGDDSWVGLPRFSWSLTAGTRYAILLYMGFDTSGPKMTSTSGVLWTEPLEIVGLGTIPSTLGYVADHTADANYPATPDRAAPGKQLTPTPRVNWTGTGASAQRHDLRVLPQMRLTTSTGSGSADSADAAMDAYLAAIA